MDKFVLKLYVTGQTVRSRRAIGNLQHMCDRSRGRFEIEVIDVLERPECAEEQRILATPTLVKERPLPMRRIIGDLSDTEKVVLGLDMRPIPGEAVRTELPRA